MEIPKIDGYYDVSQYLNHPANDLDEIYYHHGKDIARQVSYNIGLGIREIFQPTPLPLNILVSVQYNGDFKLDDLKIQTCVAKFTINMVDFMNVPNFAFSYVAHNFCIDLGDADCWNKAIFRIMNMTNAEFKKNLMIFFARDETMEWNNLGQNMLQEAQSYSIDFVEMCRLFERLGIIQQRWYKCFCHEEYSFQ